MINIQDITPFMKPGWVACDSDNNWIWFEKEPDLCRTYWANSDVFNSSHRLLDCFDIAPADDWTKSLQKVGGK